MHYLGRMPVSLITDEGNPAAGYLISVRSLPNKMRKFHPRGDRLYVGPLGEPTPEQLRDAPLIFYNTMLAKGNMMIVTNGNHTDQREKIMPATGEIIPVQSFESHFTGKLSYSECEIIMSEWGCEDDSMSTPRVALVRTPEEAFFSIATKYDGAAGVGAIRVSVSSYHGLGLPTYKEENGQVVSWSIPNSDHLQSCLLDLPIYAREPLEIAEKLIEFAPEHAIAAAGAIFKNGKWEVAYKNLFETEEDFYRKYPEARK